MDNDESAFVDFRCQYCNSLLCRTDGDAIRMRVRSFAGEEFDSEYAEVTLKRVDLVCGGCGLTRIWRREREYERKRTKGTDRGQH